MRQVPCGCPKNLIPGKRRSLDRCEIRLITIDRSKCDNCGKVCGNMPDRRPLSLRH